MNGQGPSIEVRNLVKRFGGFVAVDDVSFDVPAGEIFGFLDEPTGGVDPISRRNFWDLIYRLSGEGITVFVTTHFLDEAEHCSTIGFLYFGRLIAFGSPRDLKSKYMTRSILEVESSRP